jgi:hypothetical protein
MEAAKSRRGARARTRVSPKKNGVCLNVSIQQLGSRSPVTHLRNSHSVMDAKIFDQSNRKFVTFYESFSPSIVPVKTIQQQKHAENERADLIGSW